MNTLHILFAQFRRLALALAKGSGALLLTAVLLASGCTQNPTIDQAIGAQDAESTPALVTVSPRKSPNDTREYRYLTLPNQLKVLLVSDPETDKSAAALSVYRGSFHEPNARPGLAHFLEHMLFIGTETYPEVDSFQQYITANGGSSNAYTALDHTNYFFDIKNSALAEGLDRFGHFFIDPLLSPEYVEREKNAVHSEYQMQLKDDGWRGYMVSKQALNPEHPGHRFTIGSLDTLKGDVKADLDRWFAQNYSADQMGLVVLANASLDDLQALVEPLFNQVPNYNIGSDYPTVPAYTDAQLPAMITSQTQKNAVRLSVAFPVPNTLPYYRTKPEQYISNMLGHEGEGSLHSLLIQRGWIESLGAGTQSLDRNTSLISANFELTKAGSNHVPEIMGLFFAQIDMLKSVEPEAWRYSEQAKVAELAFQFQERGSTVGFVYQMAPRLNEYPPEDLLAAPYLMEGFEPDLIKELLARMTPENVLVELALPDFQSSTVEPWFAVPFAIAQGPVPIEMPDNPPLNLPPANPFLPENLSLLDPDDAPIALAVDQPGLQLWLDTDVSFTTPRANIVIELAVPDGLVSLRDASMARLFTRLVNDELTQSTYPALLAGLGYNLSRTASGFAIDISGYNDKQADFLAFVIDQLLTAPLVNARFDSIKQSLIRDLENAAKDKPYNQTLTALSDTLLATSWPAEAQATLLADLTLDELRAWRSQQFKRLSVRGGLHGNVAIDDANALADLLTTLLPLDQVAHTRPMVRQLTQSAEIDLAVDHDDAALLLYVQDPDDSFSSRAKSALAGQLLRSPFFSSLRTDQQLGYVVSAGMRRMDTQSGNLFLVQSPSAGVAHIENAVIEFLQDYLAQWGAMTEAAFEQQKAGLMTRLLEKDKNLNQRSQRYWQNLAEENDRFDSNQQIAELVDALTKVEMKAFLEGLTERVVNRRLKIFSDGAFKDEAKAATASAS
jgi:secreted Zn-dependent insulinase-like peptidase